MVPRTAYHTPRTAHITHNDIGSPACDLVSGQVLWLPGNFFTNPTKKPPQIELVNQLRNHLATCQPTPPQLTNKQPTFINRGLANSNLVFLQNRSVRPPLTPPYKGPYHVLTQSDKTYTIEINGKPIMVSTDRIKACHSLPTNTSPTTTNAKIPMTETSAQPRPSASPPTPAAPSTHKQILTSATTCTRSGWQVHFPSRYLS